MADRLLLWGLRACAGVSAAVFVLLAGFVLAEAWPALSVAGPARFLTDPSWHPSQGRYGLAPMIAGTGAVTLGAIALAGPIGVLSAVFRTWFAPPRVGRAYRRMLELAAGVPSVVYGFWGLVVLVPLIARMQPPGASLLAGLLVVGLMILPTVMLLADSAIGAVPRDDIEAAAALGLGRPAVLRGVVLPVALPGIAGALLLATARAIGETMAVLMVTGNVVQVPSSLFAPVRTLTANIALEMAYAMELHRAALFVGGLALVAVVGVLVGGAERVAERTRG